MVKSENLDVWPLSNWELVSHFFIFRSIADAICHTLFYKREMILERYAEVYSNQFTTGKSPFQLVQCSTVLNRKKPDINLMKTGIGQSKYRNLPLFHVVWSVPAKVFLTVTFWPILTDHDLFGSDIEQDWSYTVFAVFFFFTLTKHSKKL